MFMHRSMECMEACNVERCLIYLTLTWRGTLSRARFSFHNYTCSFNFLEGKVMAILPFKKRLFWDYLGLPFLFHVDSLVSLCVRLYALSNSCKHPPNSTSDWLTVTCYPLPQPIIINVIVSCPPTKEEQ